MSADSLPDQGKREGEYTTRVVAEFLMPGPGDGLHADLAALAERHGGELDHTADRALTVPGDDRDAREWTYECPNGHQFDYRSTRDPKWCPGCGTSTLSRTLDIAPTVGIEDECQACGIELNEARAVTARESAGEHDGLVLCGGCRDAAKLRAENDRLREDFENALSALKVIGRPGENYGLSDRLARSVALAAYVDLAPASDDLPLTTTEEK